ncbi:hypothetical protein BLX88_23980, partial [Bacillus obstructivus]
MPVRDRGGHHDGLRSFRDLRDALCDHRDRNPASDEALCRRSARHAEAGRLRAEAAILARRLAV